MGLLPVICDSCGTFFTMRSPFGNLANATFVGNTAGPCPTCGGVGHIPDGVYNLIGNTIELLKGTPRTAAELHRIATRLKTLRDQGAEPKEVRRVIEQELPEVRSLGDLRPNTRQDWYAFIAILIALLTLLASSGSQTTINVEQVINKITVVAPRPGAVTRSAPPQKAAKKAKGSGGLRSACGARAG